MIILRLKGGLGNQMFQYIRAFRLSKQLGCEISIDTCYLKRDNIRSFKLNCFENIDLLFYHGQNSFSLMDSIKPGYYHFLKKKINWIDKKTFISENNAFKYCPNVIFDSSKTYIIDGYFQSIRYIDGFEEEVRKILLVDKNLELVRQLSIYSEIINTNSVAIHIRRGDYLNADTKALHGVCEQKYYEAAIHQMELNLNEPKFFVFSDDYEWAKRKFKRKKIFVVPPREDFIHFVLMSKCKHQIIANSSFSWWAGWLNSNKKKRIIMPEFWLSNLKTKNTDLTYCNTKII